MDAVSLRGFPFQNRFFALSSQVQMHYVQEGAGPVLLCLHGNPTWSFFFRHIIQRLSRNHTVIAVDHIGCGLSSKPENYSYSLKTHIENLEQFVLAHELKKINLLVHDWGGAIGFGFAVKYPQLINKVIISNTAAFRSRDIPFSISICKIPFVGEKLIRRFNVFSRAAVFMATAKGLSNEAKTGLLFPYDSYRNRIAVSRFVEDIPLRPSHPSFATLKEIELGLYKITGQKMLLWGMKDFCFHEEFLSLWRKIYPDARVEELEQAGHYLFEDEPEKTVALIEEFLGEHRSTH